MEGEKKSFIKYNKLGRTDTEIWNLFNNKHKSKDLDKVISQFTLDITDVNHATDVWNATISTGDKQIDNQILGAIESISTPSEFINLLSNEKVQTTGLIIYSDIKQQINDGEVHEHNGVNIPINEELNKLWIIFTSSSYRIFKDSYKKNTFAANWTGRKKWGCKASDKIKDILIYAVNNYTVEELKLISSFYNVGFDILSELNGLDKEKKESVFAIMKSLQNDLNTPYFFSSLKDLDLYAVNDNIGYMLENHEKFDDCIDINGNMFSQNHEFITDYLRINPDFFPIFLKIYQNLDKQLLQFQISSYKSYNQLYDNMIRIGYSYKEIEDFLQSMGYYQIDFLNSWIKRDLPLSQIPKTIFSRNDIFIYIFRYITQDVEEIRDLFEVSNIRVDLIPFIHKNIAQSVSEIYKLFDIGKKNVSLIPYIYQNITQDIDDIKLIIGLHEMREDHLRDQRSINNKDMQNLKTSLMFCDSIMYDEIISPGVEYNIGYILSQRIVTDVEGLHRLKDIIIDSDCDSLKYVWENQIVTDVDGLIQLHSVIFHSLDVDRDGKVCYRESKADNYNVLKYIRENKIATDISGLKDLEFVMSHANPSSLKYIRENKIATDISGLKDLEFVMSHDFTDINTISYQNYYAQSEWKQILIAVLSKDYSWDAKVSLLNKLSQIPSVDAQEYIDIYYMFEMSDSSEIQVIKDNLIQEILKSPNPTILAQNINASFSDSHTPMVYKILGVFKYIYTKEVMDQELESHPGPSPYLLSCDTYAKKLSIIEKDLMKIMLDSGEKSLIEYVHNLKNDHAETNNKFPDILRKLGYEDYEDVLKRADEVKRNAHERGISLHNQYNTSGNILDPNHNYFLKGISKDSFAGILNRGVTAQEYLGGSEDSDQKVGSNGTPFDTDGVLVQGINVIDTAKNHGYGNIKLLIDIDRGGIYDTTNGLDKYNDNFYEIFQNHGTTATSYYGIRTGIASTEFDSIMITGIEDEKEINELKYEISKNGFYLPILDTEGKLIFSVEEYNFLRQGFMFSKKYSGQNLQNGVEYFTSEIPKINRGSQDLEQFIYIQQGLDNPYLREENASIIQNTYDLIQQSLKEKFNINFNNGGAKLYDSGSSGRGTSIPSKDIDIDFTLILSSADYAKIGDIQAYIHEIIGTTENSDHETLEGNGIQIKSKKNVLGKEYNKAEGVQFDLLILKKSDKISYPSNIAMYDRYCEIEKNLGLDSLDFVKTNVIIMKKLLKSQGVYKNTEGGMGGIGVENRIIQHHGNFVEALEAFENIAYGGNYSDEKKPLSFDEFQNKYYIFDSGQNFKDGKNDNYILKMNEDGYNGILKIIQHYRKSGLDGIIELLELYEQKKSEFL